jgi:hypothetical protein
LVNFGGLSRSVWQAFAISFGGLFHLVCRLLLNFGGLSRSAWRAFAISFGGLFHLVWQAFAQFGGLLQSVLAGFLSQFGGLLQSVLAGFFTYFGRVLVNFGRLSRSVWQAFDQYLRPFLFNLVPFCSILAGFFLNSESHS